MKKVLFTATVDSHILQFHIPYLKFFKEQGYEVHVATNGNEEIPYCDKKHLVSFERSPIKINNLKAIRQLKKIIDKEKFEIIHCHTPMGSVVTRLAAKKARKKYNTRVIYTAHGFHFYKGAPLLNWLIFYPIEKWLSRYTDTLITINEEDYNIAKKRFKAKNIELVYGVGIDVDKFNSKMPEKEKHELRNSIGLNDNDFVMIYVAELSKRKNQEMLLNIMPELINKDSSIKLLLVGGDSLNGKLQDIVHENNLDNNVFFLGYRKDVPELLKISNLLVSTSKQEGLPVNVMEGLATGLPAVVTDCRGNRDLVRDGVDGFIVKNKEMLISKIIQIKENKDNLKFISKDDLAKIDIKNIQKDMKRIYLKG